MADRARVLALLDELHASECAGTSALADWIEQCREPALRGGLRVIRSRDVAHAALAAQRLRALGAEPRAEVTTALRRLCEAVRAQDVADRSKLGMLVARFPGTARGPIDDALLLLDGDRETRALVETIGDDDRASLAWLRTMADEAPSDEVEAGPSTEVLGFLDTLRAAEDASADVLMAWIDVCRLDGLRGGLRTIAAREASHASLLAERLVAADRAPMASLRPEVAHRALETFGDVHTRDEDKLARLLERYPDEDAVTAPIDAMVATLGGDGETREILRLIAAGERASMSWLRAYDHSMAPGTAHLRG